MLLGLGSSVERERHIAIGLDALQALFGELQLSSVYDGPAIGFEGDPFLNMAVQVETTLSLAEVVVSLRDIEFANGRDPQAERYSPRALDIDLLTFGVCVGEYNGVTLPREEILHNAFVLRPVAELVPNGIHPITGLTYASLWEAYDAAAQPLRRIAFTWGGRDISHAE